MFYDKVKNSRRIRSDVNYKHIVNMQKKIVMYLGFNRSDGRQKKTEPLRSKRKKGKHRHNRTIEPRHEKTNNLKAVSE